MSTAATEHVIVLFTDMVGSTALSSSLSVEAGDEVRRTHFSLLRQAIAANDGREVKNLGDGLMVVFATASAALTAATAMQQAVDHQNRTAGVMTGLRVGLSCGEATREADDYFGDPVVEAARLCARAESGQILLAEVVRAVAGRRSPQQFNTLGEMELKGLPEPIGVLEIVWEALDVGGAEESGVVPLPKRLAEGPREGVIGRLTELAALEDAAKRVAGNAGREVILVAGEPGQGKSTLLGEFARRAFDQGLTVLLGRCDEEVGASYRPFHEALSSLVVHAPESLLRDHVKGCGSDLSRLTGALGQRLGGLAAPPASDPETERYLLFGAVADLFERASNERPVVLVLEDLHWADKPTLQLLRHLVAHSGVSRILVICSYRDAEVLASHPLSEALGALRREERVSRVALRGLGDDEVVAFVEAAAGHELDDNATGLAHALYRETDGNPYFVAEMLRHLTESGAIHRDENGQWLVAEADPGSRLPDSVREVIGSRVGRIGETAVGMLRTAAVIGRDFDFDVLAEASALSEDELLDLLAAAEAAALVREDPARPGRFSFSHALVQHTLYEELGGIRRARVHRQIGEAIERLAGRTTTDRVTELARHFVLAVRPSEMDKAIEYSCRAGDAALAALAPDAAVSHFAQALDLLRQAGDEPTQQRVDVLIGLGTAQRQAGLADYRAILLEAARLARTIGDTPRLVAAALANTRGFFSSLAEIDTEKVEILETAIAVLGDEVSAEKARLVATLCAELAYAPAERRLGLARSAKELARQVGDPATSLEVLNRCAVALWIPETLDEQVSDGTEAMRLAKQVGDPTALFFAAQQGYTQAIHGGDFELACERLAAAKEVAERLNQPAFRWTVTYIEAAHATVNGNPDRAEQLATAAVDLGLASGQPDTMTFYGTALVEIRQQQGRLGELAELIADMLEQNPEVPAYTSALAMARLDGGNTDDARRMVEEMTANGFPLPEDFAWADGVTAFAEVAIELDAREAAGQLYELLAPFASQVCHNSLMSRGPIAMYLGGLCGVLGRYDDARQHFATSYRLCDAGEMVYFRAATQLWQGRMLLAAGDATGHDRGIELLGQARTTAAERRYVMVERRAADALARLTSGL